MGADISTNDKLLERCSFWQIPRLSKETHEAVVELNLEHQGDRDQKPKIRQL